MQANIALQDDISILHINREAELIPMAGGKQPQEPPIIISGTLGWVTTRLGVPPWGQVLVVVLALGSYGLYHWLDKIDEHLTGLDTRLQVMPLQLTKDLLAQAQTDVNLGHYEQASRATESARAVIAKALVQKIRPPEGYFDEALTALNSLGASTSNATLFPVVHNTRLMLADYRSALEPQPRQRAYQRTVESPQVSVSDIANDKGTVLVFDNSNPESELVPHSLTGSFGLEDLTIVAPNGGYVTLDGLRLENVVFVGLHVKYEGGNVNLQYVRFVNCTFEASPDGKGQRLIDYVALAQNKLVITG